MFISDQSVRRPVFATVISALLVILGLAALVNLPVRQYPDVDAPIVSVSTTYRGASSEVVETKVTQVIEDVIAGIEGIEKLTSTSRDERSDIRLEFSLSRDIESAANDVRDRRPLKEHSPCRRAHCWARPALPFHCLCHGSLDQPRSCNR